MKFGCAVFELCERTDKQADRQTDILITVLYPLPGGGGKVIITHRRGVDCTAFSCICESVCLSVTVRALKTVKLGIAYF